MMEWKEENLVDCLELIIDYRGKTPTKSESGVFTLSAKSVKMGKIDYSQAYFISGETYEKFMVRGFPLKGDILMTTEAPLGQIAKLDRDNVCVAQRLLTLRPKEEVLNNDYLMYYLMSKRGQYELLSRATGSTVQGIKRSEFKYVKIVLPPIQEQKEIARTLSSLDEKITLLRQQNETLEQMAQTLFKRWFVDFEFPNEQGQPYQSSGGKMVASELGAIPEGWEWSTLGDLATNKASSFKFSEKNVVFINTGDVLEGNFLHKKYSNPNNLPGQAKKAIERNDILYSEIRPKNKRFAFVDFNSKDYVVSTKFMIIRAKEGMCQKILYLMLKRKESINQINNIAESRSGTFPQITFDAISDFRIIKAPISIQSRFLKLLEVTMDKQKNNTNEIQTLTKLRDTLLPKLMSGEIRVSTAAIEK